MIQRLIEQVPLLSDLKEFIWLTAPAAKHTTPSVLSRALPFRRQVVLSRHILARVQRRDSDHFIDGQLQLVPSILCRQDRFTPEQLGVPQPPRKLVQLLLIAVKAYVSSKSLVQFLRIEGAAQAPTCFANICKVVLIALSNSMIEWQAPILNPVFICFEHQTS